MGNQSFGFSKNIIMCRCPKENYWSFHLPVLLASFFLQTPSSDSQQIVSVLVRCRKSVP